MKRRTSPLIRRLEHGDVRAVLDVIRDCRVEYGLEHRVPAVLEPDDYALFDVYQRPRSAYFVAVVDGDLVGGGGFAPLAASDGDTCELQRMYLRKTARGMRIGHALLTRCIRAARDYRFKSCYAETISEMTTAIAFYERHGFVRLDESISKTGHNHNDCWLMLHLGNQSS